MVTKAGWDKASQPVVAKMITELGLDPAKVQWIAAVHRHQRHGNNPHIHLLLWEHGTPSRKTGEWNKQELKNIKQQWVSQLYQPERTQLGQQKSQTRTQVRDTVKTLITPANEQQGFQQELVQRLQALGQMLPKKGRLAYAYMPPPVKVEVAETIRWLWTQDSALKTQHDRYLLAAEKMTTFYWHVDDAKSQDTPGREAAIAKARAHAEGDLLQRVAPEVLKAAHTEAWRAQWRREKEALSQVLSDDMIEQVMQGTLSLPELMATPTVRKLRQEAECRIFAPFPTLTTPPSHFPASTYAPLTREWTFSLPSAAPDQRKFLGEHILATSFDPDAAKRQGHQVTDQFVTRLAKHVRRLAGERGLRHCGRTRMPDLHAAFQRVMHQAEQDAARTAYWLAASQYQRRKAEIAMAHSVGQELTL